MFTVYIPPHDEETEIKVLHAIHRCIELMGIPYLICGDFNEHPYDFDKWGWAPMARGCTYLPRDTPITCYQGQGSLIDWGIDSEAVEHIMQGAYPVYDFPFKTHIVI